jgi:hypothetical protein
VQALFQVDDTVVAKHVALLVQGEIAMEAAVGGEEVAVDLVEAVGRDLARTGEELHTVLEVEGIRSEVRCLVVRRRPRLMRHL